MLRVGIAGIGFMGWIHWLAYQRNPHVKVTAICETSSERRRGDWTGIQGNFGPPGEHVDLSDVQVFSDLIEFSRGDFDLLDVCLPPALHRQAIELGAATGKDLFCEKPLALTVDDCRSALETCQRHKVMLLVGHVLPYFPEFRTAQQIVESGKYGDLTSGYFKRIVSNPLWIPNFFDPTRIGGPLFDLHVHDAHFIRVLAGMPSGVYSRGHLQNGLVRFCHSLFDFPNSNVAIASTMGIIDQQGRPFTHGFEIQMRDATLHFEFASLKSGPQQMPLKIITADGEVSLIETGNADPVEAFVAEIDAVVECLRTRCLLNQLSGEYGAEAIAICDAEWQSVRSKQRVPVRL